MKIAIVLIILLCIILLYLVLTGYSMNPDSKGPATTPIPHSMSPPGSPTTATATVAAVGKPVPAVTTTPSLFPEPSENATLPPGMTPSDIPPSVTATPTPFLIIPPRPAKGNPYDISSPGIAREVHSLVNHEREAAGLPDLAWDDALTDIAVAHSADMAAAGYFSHDDLSGSDPTVRALTAGYNCTKDFGSYYTFGISENIFQNNLYDSAVYFSNRSPVYYWNSPDTIAGTTVGGWMNSSGHRKNILSAVYDREGIGVAVASDDKVYITEDFC